MTAAEHEAPVVDRRVSVSAFDLSGLIHWVAVGVGCISKKAPADAVDQWDY